MKPAVSVIIPTFNRAPLVVAAVRSVFAQTLQSYEVIVVDDGSTDATEEALKLFASVPEFQYLRQPNSGRSAARNAGLALARGDFLLFLDSDDLLLPDALAVLHAAAAARPAAGMIVGHTQFVDEELRLLRTLAPEVEAEGGRCSAYPELIRAPFALLPGAFIVRRDEIEAAGAFDPLSEPCEDLDFALRVALRCEVACVGSPVVQHRMHGGNTPETNILLGRLKVARKHLRLLEHATGLSAASVARSRANWRVKMGDSYYLLGDNWRPLSYYLFALALRPRNLGERHLRRQILASLVPSSLRKSFKSLPQS